MGPDLLGASFDVDEAMRRFRSRSDASIADALINQRVVAGAGNVFKSELLFLCGINPFLCVADVSDDDLRCLLSTGQKYLRANVVDPSATIVTYTGYRRTTRRMDPSERLYVYGRARRPCRKCGTSIEVKAQGRDARLTYWCPSCQKPRTEGTSVGSGMRDPGCGMRNADPRLQGPRTETEDQGLKTVDQRPRTRDEGQGTE
jgi:endonuclease-8